MGQKDSGFDLPELVRLCGVPKLESQTLQLRSHRSIIKVRLKKSQKFVRELMTHFSQRTSVSQAGLWHQMSSCTFATPRVEVLRSRGSPLSARAARSSSSSVRAPAPSSRSARYSAGARARRIVAASANGSCSRDLLVVGPGVLGSLVCQRWLGVSAILSRLSSARSAQPPSLGFSSTFFVNPLFLTSSPTSSFPCLCRNFRRLP